MVQILYSHYTDNREFVNRRINTDSYDKACEIIDQYPWAREVALFEELGAAGGFEFVLGDRKGPHAIYMLTPIEAERRGSLHLDVVAKTGMFNLLGRRSLSRDFHIVTADTAKEHLRELFEHSVEFIHEKHRPFKR
ncbi:hypothetical protein ACGLWX_04000 [Halomonas sp. HMF6819]|uniref:hypothetical protein n=1 Tax=Halomonas sp. HMF6819 TaxID=3373085 RepID=UPI0037A736CC